MATIGVFYTGGTETDRLVSVMIQKYFPGHEIQWFPGPPLAPVSDAYRHRLEFFARLGSNIWVVPVGFDLDVLPPASVHTDVVTVYVASRHENAVTFEWLRAKSQ